MADSDAPSRWYPERGTAVAVALIGIFATMVAILGANDDDPVLVRFAYLRIDQVRYAMSAVVLLAALRIEISALGWLFFQRPLLEAGPASLRIFSFFGVIKLEYSEITRIEVLPDGGFEFCSPDRRVFKLPVRDASWQEIVAEIRSRIERTR